MQHISKTTLRKLLYVIHLSQVNIRNLSRGDYRHAIHDIADTFEVFPSWINMWDEDSLSRIRAEIVALQKKHGELVCDYLYYLDMTDDEFEKLYSNW